MKLQNKKTCEPTNSVYDEHFDSLAKLNEKWEDYKEQKYCYIATCGDIFTTTDTGFPPDKFSKEIGNYFETKEEAEKAVEKLKAWKRLKDKGFKFTGWEDLNTLDPEESLLVNRDVVDGACVVGFRMENYEDCINDLDLLFGGEE